MTRSSTKSLPGVIPRRRVENGFTLIEAIVSALLTVVILLAVYQLMVSGQQIYITQEEVTAMDAQARVAMDMIVQALRQAGNDPSANAFTAAQTSPLSVPVPEAYANAIRILADLPQDVWLNDCTAGSDGDTFDSCNNDSDSVWDDNENENGDGQRLPASNGSTTSNADPEEDVMFLLTPSDSTTYVPSGPGPWTLVKRYRTAGQTLSTFTDVPIASNILALEFRYIQKIVPATGVVNKDTLPASFATRWAGVSGTGVALNASSYSAANDLRLINRVLVRLTVRSAQRDRITRQYRSITLEEDVDIREQTL